MRSIEITFWTQLLTVPFFVAVWAAGAMKSSSDNDAAATTTIDAATGEPVARRLDVATGETEEAEAPFGPLVRRAGLSLGAIWMLGGLIETSGFAAGASASHGAFLGQMSTLLVPLGSAAMGNALNPKVGHGLWFMNRKLNAFGL